MNQILINPRLKIRVIHGRWRRRFDTKRRRHEKDYGPHTSDLQNVIIS